MKVVILDEQGHFVRKNVLTVDMDMPVCTTVVVTVCITLCVTNKLVTVTGDVTRDISTATAAENAVMDIWIGLQRAM